MRNANLLAACFGMSAGFGIVAADAQTQGESFSFSAEAEKARADAQAAQAQQAAEIDALVSVPCQQRLKNRKILQLVAERNTDGWQTSQERYGPFFQVIDQRLRALGLKTYTQEQIRQHIAQAELEAYFNNDPDAALSASRRLAADYFVRGSISTTAAVNPAVQVNEVAVNVELILSDAGGRVLSEVAVHSESYSGSDTLGTAFALVREQADRMVAQLYNDYCRKGMG
jgi:hypothetical protein